MCACISKGVLDWERMWEETGWSVGGGGPSEHPGDDSEIDGQHDEDISSYSDESSQNSPRLVENVDTESIETLSTPSDCIEDDVSFDLSPLPRGVFMDQKPWRYKLLIKDYTEDRKRKKPTDRRNSKLQTSTPLVQRGEREVSSVDLSQQFATCTLYMHNVMYWL